MTESNNDMLVWQDMSTGRHRILDPRGTLYNCDANGYKKQRFLPQITGLSNYRVRVKHSILDRVSSYCR